MPLDLFPEGGDRAELVAREAVQEETPHSVEVGPPRVREHGPALVGDLREQAAGVARAALALQKTLALEPVHQPGKAAAAEQDLVRELGHAHPALVRVVQE